MLQPQRDKGTSSGNSTVWNGFKLIEGNIDKNYIVNLSIKFDKKTPSCSAR